MNEIFTAIDIDAPPAVIWEALVDFEAYPEWNDRMRIRGRAVEGERLRVSPGPAAGRAPAFRPRVLRVIPETELRWLGHLYVRGLFDGEHVFTIEDLGEGRSRLNQHEEFSGLLAGFLLKRYGDATEENFEAVNAALKARAEATARGGQAPAASRDGIEAAGRNGEGADAAA
jgi:hypothetical protein